MRHARLGRTACAGAFLVAVAGIGGNAEAGGITAPGFMRFRLFNATSRTVVTSVVVKATVPGAPAPIDIPVSLPAGGLFANDWTQSGAGNIANVSSVEVTLTINGMPNGPVSTTPFTWTSGESIGNCYVIVSDGDASHSVVTMRYALYDDATWTWQTPADVTLRGAGGCVPATPVVSFTGATLYNGSAFLFPAFSPVLRFHSPTLGYADSVLSSSLYPGQRWYDLPPGFVDADSVATLPPVAPCPAIVADTSHEVIVAFFFYTVNASGVPSTTSHGVVHHDGSAPYWEFR